MLFHHSRPLESKLDQFFYSGNESDRNVIKNGKKIVCRHFLQNIATRFFGEGDGDCFLCPSYVECLQSKYMEHHGFNDNFLIEIKIKILVSN